MGTRWMGKSLALALVGAVGVIASTAPAASAPPDEVVAGSYIVTIVDGVSPRSVAAQHANENAAQVDHLYEHALNGYAAHMSETAAARVASDPRVASVVPDRVVRISAKRQAGGGAASQTLPTGINRIDGELSSAVAGNGSGSVSVDVAVIDTGIDVDHPDLNVVGGVNCSTGTSFDDGNGHGTHVAGTIGALDNGVGVVGVAPGAQLWAVRVLNNAGSGTWSSIICGVDWVTRNAGKIKVANMSLGGSGSEPAAGGCSTGDPLHDAICRSVAAGVTHVVAAGNETDDAKNHVPAAYDEVITVSALADFDGLPGGQGRATCRSDVDDTFASFSNYGADIDLIAPGVCINSTWKGGGYKSISGTSMASPHVAGAAALHKSSNPDASPAQVISTLQGAGNLTWSNSDGHDGIQEKLLNVDTF